MAFEITSDTVVKILVRRGLEVERLETLLSEGELGLSVDSRRLFIGDGYTPGGTPVGNINFGIVSNLADIIPYAQPGDMASNNNLSFTFSNNSWVPVSPIIYQEFNNNTPDAPTTVEYSPSPLNGLRVSRSGLGDGMLVDYSQGANGNIGYTIQQAYGIINFDARFLSLCAFRTVYDLNDGPRIGSLYFGNIFTSTTKDNLSSTVNVEKNLSINDHTLSAYQLQMYARNSHVNNSLIDATSGSLYIRSKGPIYLGTGTSGGSALSISDTNVTVYGNLSVLGDLAYLNSVVSVTSALSVINDGTGPAFVVNQKGTQPVAHFQDDGATALFIADGGNVGVGTTSPAAKLTVSGNISVNGNSTLGDANTDTTIIRGIAKIADSSQTNGLLFGTGNASYDVNLYRNATNALKTDDNLTVDLSLTVNGDSTLGNISVNGNSTLGDANTDTTIIRGIAKIADSSQTNGLLFGTGNASYDVNLYRDAANSLKTDDSLTVVGTTSLGNTLTLGDAVNIVLDTTTGSKIGTATTQKLSFYNATPVIQRSSANQAAVAAYVAGSNGYSTATQAQAIITLVNEIRTTLVNLGLMKGAA